MTRLSAILAVAVLSSIATPVVVSATGARSKPGAALTVSAEAAVAAVAEKAAAAEPACTRRIKVVYAGYGEGSGLPCTTTAEAKR
jgi:hypothetical protein